MRSRRATSIKATTSNVVQSSADISPGLDSTPMTPRTLSKTVTERFSECIYASNTVNIEKLRKLSWSGIPTELRPICWKLLIVSVRKNNLSYAFRDTCLVVQIAIK